MDLSSAQALLLVCKSNAVKQVMLTGYKEEARAFANFWWPHCSSFPEPLARPATQCRMRVGSEQCLCAVSELSVTNMCAYHQVRHRGDLNVDAMRAWVVREPYLFQWRLQ